MFDYLRIFLKQLFFTPMGKEKDSLSKSVFYYFIYLLLFFLSLAATTKVHNGNLAFKPIYIVIWSYVNIECEWNKWWQDPNGLNGLFNISYLKIQKHFLIY